MKFINRTVSIFEVAKRLGLRFDGCGMIHCWHPERHQNGDRTASVGVRKRNNTTKCFGCGGKPMGPIDLVMDVRSIGCGDAAKWIAERFSVKYLDKRKHLEHADRPRIPYGHEDRLGLLIQSGLWATLSECTRCVAPVLLQLGEWAPQKRTASLTVSYLAISRFSGVKSPNAVGKALSELAEVNWLVRGKCPTKPGSVIRETASYTITPYSDELVELANATAERTRKEIDAEKEMRENLRRRHQRAAGEGGSELNTYYSLYATNSAWPVVAIPRVAPREFSRARCRLKAS